jgi:phosphatidylserine/phosphatidylglycerophosphate/cardiolipin synthase-like enzyme
VKLLHSAASIIKSPWQQSFLDLISAAQLDLLIASPFVKVQATDRILSNLRERGVDRGIRVVLLTNLRPESILNGSTDICFVSPPPLLAMTLDVPLSSSLRKGTTSPLSA